MKVKYEFVIREIAGDYIMVPAGEAALKFQSIITTNEVGASIWNAIKEGKNEEGILAAILEEYEIDEEKAKEDITKFINSLVQLEIIEL